MSVDCLLTLPLFYHFPSFCHRLSCLLGPGSEGISSLPITWSFPTAVVIVMSPPMAVVQKLNFPSRWNLHTNVDLVETIMDMETLCIFVAYP